MSLKGLLAAVLDSPGDDLPRLAYADWLDDHGGEAERSRAGLIRAQVALAAMGEDDPRRPGLEAQEAEALGRLGPPQWEEELHTSVHEAGLHRGFIERVKFMLVDASLVGRMMRRAPVREVELIGPGPFEPLARWPHPERLRSLTIDEAEDGDLQLLRLASFRRFVGLKELRVVGCEADDDVPFHLLQVGRWPALETLDLSRNVISFHGCVDLIDGHHLPAMRTLLLNLNELGDVDIAELLQQPGLSRLTGFGICGNESSDVAVHAVAASPHLANLRRLDLSESAMELPGLYALAVSPHLSRVTDLDVSCNGIHGARGVAQLTRGPNFQRLTALNIGLSSLGPAGARGLARWPALAGLAVLKLNSAELGDEGVLELLKAPSLARLRHLELFNNGLTDKGVTALARCEKVGRLRELVVGRNKWGVAGAEALARSPHLGRLTRLVLSLDSGGEAEQVRTVLHERFGGRVRFW